MGQRVLITGVSRHLGYRLAQRLEADDDVEYIGGVDMEELEVDLERTEFFRADIRNPLILQLMASSQADTLCHLNFFVTPTREGGRSAVVEFYAIVWFQRLAA